ncbi:hypothetical protein B0H19DRAFT_1034821 [Mycena capillaripes]|nr:hypothetical protein B0H19DRAFT_1034821 [Mycena capillaripes]
MAIPLKKSTQLHRIHLKTSRSHESSLPDFQMLPFIEDDPCGEFGGRQACMRDHQTVNRVAVECLKALRMPHTAKKGGPQDLSLLPQMPMDILLEVLGHLHPIDLMHVARVNHAFRGLLHAPLAEPLWRSAFVGRSPLPTCPPEISGRRWSKLLFGRRMCDECGTPDTSPDHRIWRRLCTNCMNLKLFFGPPSYSSSHIINTLVAKSFRFDGGSNTGDSDTGRLWPADGTAVAQEYERIKAADEEARLRGDDSPGALDAFIEARKKAVQVIEERAEEAEAWSDAIFDESLGPCHERSRRVAKSACKRLIEEGYDPQDVENAQDLSTSPYLEYFPRLTSKRWNKIRPHLLPLVNTARTERLERERLELVARRTAAVITAVSHVLRTAPAESWPYVPPQYTIEALPSLQALIQDPSDVPLADSDARLADALLELPAFVAAWRAEKRALLVSLLPPPTASESEAESACASSESDRPSPTRVASDSDQDRLALATSVFTCLGSWVGAMSVTAGRALIGWDAAGGHLRCRSLRSFWERRLHFAPDGAAAAAALVRLVGLDPLRATAAQMDAVCGDEGKGKSKGMCNKGEGKAMDKRFVCMLCPVEAQRWLHGRRAMRWRECVQHTVERARMGGGDEAHSGVAPVWALLTDAAVEDVRRREKPDPFVYDSAWGCALCTAHYEVTARVSRAAAVEHLRVEHRILAPEEGRHFLYFVGTERTPRVPALLSQEGHVTDLRCTRCTNGKLRALRDISRHVADKHKIPTPTEADWTRVELILRTTPTSTPKAGSTSGPAST